MKKIIIILCLICSLDGVYAQKNNEDSLLLNSILEKIKNNESYKLLGCLINEEFPGEPKPFVKKMACDFGDLVIFVTSFPFSKDINLSVDNIIISHKKTGDEYIYQLMSDSEILNKFLNKQEEKPFQYVYGILD